MSTTFELNRLARHLMEPKPKREKNASGLTSFLARREPGASDQQFVDNARFYRMMKTADPGSLAAAEKEYNAEDALIRENGREQYEALKKIILPDNVIKKDEDDRAEQLRVNEMKPTPTAADSLKSQLTSLTEKVDSPLDGIKTALDDSTKAIIGLPVAGAGAGAALYGLAGMGRSNAPALGKRLALGGGTGAAMGAGLAGIIGLGKLLEQADPSGNTLATAVQLAPAVAAVAGAISDMNSEKRAQAMRQLPLDQLAALADMDKEGSQIEDLYASLEKETLNLPLKKQAEPTRGTSFIFKEPKHLPKATFGRISKMTDKELRSEYRRTKGIQKMVGDKPTGKHRVGEGIYGAGMGTAFAVGARAAGGRLPKRFLPAAALTSGISGAALAPNHWGTRSGLKIRKKWIEDEAKGRGMKLAFRKKAMDPLSVGAPILGTALGGLKALKWSREMADIENPTEREEAIASNPAVATIAGAASGLAAGLTVGQLLRQARRAL